MEINFPILRSAIFLSKSLNILTFEMADLKIRKMLYFHGVVQQSCIFQISYSGFCHHRRPLLVPCWWRIQSINYSVSVLYVKLTQFSLLDVNKCLSIGGSKALATATNPTERLYERCLNWARKGIRANLSYGMNANGVVERYAVTWNTECTCLYFRYVGKIGRNQKFIHFDSYENEQF